MVDDPARICAVFKKLATAVGGHMNVVHTSFIMSWEYRIEVGYALVIRDLHAAQERGVEAGTSHDARVHTRCVRMPYTVTEVSCRYFGRSVQVSGSEIDYRR